MTPVNFMIGTVRADGDKPEIVVKFQDYIKLPYEAAAERHLSVDCIGPWRALAEKFPGITLKPLFTTISAEAIVEMTEAAQARDATYQPANFLAYFLLPCPPNIDPCALTRAMNNWPAVQTAIFSPPGSLPMVPPLRDTRLYH